MSISKAERDHAESGSRVIYKYWMTTPVTPIPLRASDKVLTVATQDGYPCVWVEHEWPLTGKPVLFRGVPTGGSPGIGDVYVGTAHDVQGARLVFHIYREASSG